MKYCGIENLKQSLKEYDLPNGNSMSIKALYKNSSCDEIAKLKFICIQAGSAMNNKTQNPKQKDGQKKKKATERQKRKAKEIDQSKNTEEEMDLSKGKEMNSNKKKKRQKKATKPTKSPKEDEALFQKELKNHCHSYGCEQIGKVLLKLFRTDPNLAKTCFKEIQGDQRGGPMKQSPQAPLECDIELAKTLLKIQNSDQRLNKTREVTPQAVLTFANIGKGSGSGYANHKVFLEEVIELLKEEVEKIDDS